jgi:hypothetical protein
MVLLLRLAAALLFAYAGLCALAYLFQTRLVYFPGPAPRLTPGVFGLTFRELRLAARDGTELHGWFLPAAPAQDAVLVCHGNAGSIEDRIDLARAFLELGWSVLLFDYRGYGASAGSPSEAGTYADAEAALEHLAHGEGVPAERTVLYGESLGAGVAIELARRHPVAAVIAESAFTSLADVGASVYPFLPVRWLARVRYENRAKLAELALPILLVHSPDDEIVPVGHAHALFAAARGPKQLLLTEAGHNDGGFRRRPEWRAEVGRFLAAFREPR